MVGLGYAASALHLPALRAHPALDLVGGADPDPARRAAWEAAGAGVAYPSLDALLEEARPDVVVVASPPHTHAELCVRALEAGAHVMCEKPFVENVRQADDVLAVADRTRRSVAVNHEFRYMPIFSAVRKAVGQTGVGRAVFMSCVQLMDLAPWEEGVPWRAAMERRSLFEGGVHLVDLLQSVAGRAPARVSGQASAGLDPARESDAIHLVTLDYGEGLLAQLTINRLCKAGTRYVDLRVDCEDASLRASYGGRAFVRMGFKRAERAGIRVDFGREGLAWAERGTRRRVLARNPRRATAKATAALYRDTLAAWQQGADPPTSGHLARQTLAVVDAAYRSSGTGAVPPPA